VIGIPELEILHESSVLVSYFVPTWKDITLRNDFVYIFCVLISNSRIKVVKKL
jgi:hypothetical protein